MRQFMKTITNRDGEKIQVPARGKVQEKDYQLSRQELDYLLEANANPKICPLPLKAEEVDNTAYYDSLPRYFNFNKKGEIVNSYKTKWEYNKSLGRRFNKTTN